MMKNKKLSKNKNAESLEIGLFVIFLSIIIASFAFISSDSSVTGLVTSSIDESQVVLDSLRDFQYIDSLSTLAPGSYYIDSSGVVYWLDDASRPAIARVDIVYENQKNRVISIDAEGNIDYR